VVTRDDDCFLVVIMDEENMRECKKQEKTAEVEVKCKSGN